MDRPPSVSLHVAAGRLAGIVVRTGPAADHTLDAIAASLTGAPADLGVPALAARVRAAVPFGVELVGTTPEAVAEAVARAAGQAGAGPAAARIGAYTPADIDRLTAGWKSYPWRLIPERPLPAAVNVALDEVLLDRVAAGGPPTLRFWQWTEPAVVIGRCQSLANEVDPAAASERGVRVVRRTTGGGAMFVEPHGAITYSLALPEAAVGGLTVRQSYEVCDAWAVAGLRALGIDASYVPVNDIGWAGGKIGGAAQARRRGVVLHHTTLAYEMAEADMARVLRVGRDRVRDRGTPSAAKRVSPLARQTALSREAVAGHLFGLFRATFGGTVGDVTAAELADAERLAADKYGAAAWTQEFE